VSIGRSLFDPATVLISMSALGISLPDGS
jgi:hypothetical protein